MRRMRRCRLLLGLSLPFLFSGCASLPKNLPKNPQTRSQDHLARPVGMNHGPWPKADWWKTAADPGLDALIQRALVRNPELHAATARVLLAEAETAGARSRLLPHFNASLQFTQQYFSAQGLHLSANGTSNLYGEFDPLLARYHVDLWGRDRDLVAAARGEAAVAQAGMAQTRLLLSTATVLHYFSLQGDQRLLHEEQRLQTWQKRAVLVARSTYGSGLADATQVHGTQIALAQSTHRIAALQAAITEEKHALATLAGEGPDAALPRAEGLPPMPESTLPIDLSLSLVGRRPDIVAARWAVQAAAAQVGAARAAFYPDLNLRLLAGWNSINLADLFDPANFAHAVGPALTLPIFEGGSLRANLRAQDAIFLSAQDHYQAAILAALNQVADALSNWLKLQAQAKAEDTALRAQRRQLRLRLAAWQSGLQSAMPSIQAHIALLQIAEAKTAIATARLQNWALLESALGGGYDDKGKAEDA